ncbi:MAG: transposase [Rhodobacter sp.]|nr:transposase [Rhodobacter sp.]
MRRIGAGPVARILCGPTNRYHRSLEVLLAAAGLPLAPVNPRPARRFAQAPGLQARTDKTCARMLAEMGAATDPRPAGPPPCKPAPSQGPGRRPQGAGGRPRGGWQSHRGAQSGFAAAPLPRRRRAAIEADIARTGAALAALIAADPAPGRTRPASCKACPASLRLAAATLLAEAPELGRPAARQIAALAGLAPVTRESGTWRGKASIQGGRRPLCRARTMPVLTAIRRNRDLAALFTRLHAAGKPPGPPLSRRCANASSPPTHSCAKDGTGRTQGPYKTLDEHGYWPGALAPGLVLIPAWRCGRGDGPCQDAQGARRRKRFPLCGQAAHAAATFSAPCSHDGCQAIVSWQLTRRGWVPRDVDTKGRRRN